MDPLIGSALIKGASSLFGNIFGSLNQSYANQTNLKIAQMNNEYNARMLQKQMDYNTDMWNAQNAYNDPSEQMARLKKAGINPYMALGQVTSGEAGSAGGVNPPTASPVSVEPFRPDLSGIGDAAQSYIANKLQQEAIEGTNELKSEESRQLRIQNEYEEAKIVGELNYMAEKTNSEKLKNFYQQRINRFAADSLSADYANKRRQEQDMIASIELKNVEIAIKQFQLDGLPKMYQLDLAGRTADILLKSEQKKLTKQQTIHEVQKMFKTYQEKHNLKINNSILERSADNIVNKSYSDSYSAMSPFGFMLHFFDNN